MKALVLKSPKDFVYEERKKPECLEDGLLVKVDAVCICGSDVGAILGKNSLFTYPRVLGHEVAGTVVEVGRNVLSFEVGDKVALMPCISCGHCRACVKGKTNCCSSLKLYGVQEDGGLAEYLAAGEENWLKVPENLSASDVAMIEPLAIGTHAVRKLDLDQGDNVLVIGAGPIGVTVAENARTYGANVVLADLSSIRREFVSSRFGYKVLDPSDSTYMDTVRSLTEGQLFDAVIDTTAAKPSMENCWRYIAQGGKIVFVGVCGSVLEIDGKGFHGKEPTLFVTRNSTESDFRFVLENIVNGVFKPGAFVTHRVCFKDAGDTILQWVDPSFGVFKGVVLF